MLTWTIVAAEIAIYCISRAVMDLRHKSYAWAIAGLVAGAAILLTPIQSHGVKIELPQGP